MRSKATADVTDSALELGYFLSSEEHAPSALVSNAVAAQRAGFRTAMISDHLRPWTPSQGQSSFVWSVIGAISQAAPGLEVGTGVSAIGPRVHPVVLAHAAATASLLLDGRFFLGLGTGERLNEQVVGERWPRAGERREALEEAIPLLRRLLQGKTVNHRGTWFALERARLESVPASPPPILVAAGGRRTAKVAGDLGDGLIGVAPTPTVIEAFEAGGGLGKPRVAQLKLCWASDEQAAVATVRRWFPTVGLPENVLTELSTPEEFAAVAELVTDEALADAVVCGPDPEPMAAAVRRLVAAGFSRVYLHQVGPDQAGFLRFATDELVPLLGADLAAVDTRPGRGG
jgi:coenzyme F420-dependent glucose-6-phosphate dehydrogenase